MTNPDDNSREPVLDQEVVGLIGESLRPENLSPNRKNKLFSGIMARVEELDDNEFPSHVTVRADQGEWITIAPKIDKKLLFTDSQRRIEAYLLRVQAGAELPAHIHEQDEYCLVLEGDVSFENLHLSAGDFHFARRGSRHSKVTSKGGALVYLESGIA